MDIISIAFFILGSFFFVRNITMYLNPQSLRKYIEESPKSAIWVKKFGIEKTIKLSKLIFLPMGLLISIFMTGIGFWNGILPLIR